MESLRNALVYHPDPRGLQVVQIFHLLVSIKLWYGEFTTSGMKYSKFATKEGRSLPSRLAMFICYTPTFLVCTTFLITKLAIATDSRLLIFTAATTLHFLKRVIEVLFVHKYSGSMPTPTCITIAVAYILIAVNLLYCQQISSQNSNPPTINLLPLGVFLLVVGLSGNFYHHYLLAKLRLDNSNSSKRYVVPSGGLFTLVVCPHYLFETIVFLGIALIGQTTSAFVNFLSMSIALVGRSHSTKQWYIEKLEDFPPARKAFIPYVF